MAIGLVNGSTTEIIFAISLSHLSTLIPTKLKQLVRLSAQTHWYQVVHSLFNSKAKQMVSPLLRLTVHPLCLRSWLKTTISQLTSKRVSSSATRPYKMRWTSGSRTARPTTTSTMPTILRHLTTTTSTSMVYTSMVIWVGWLQVLNMLQRACLSVIKYLLRVHIHWA